MYGPVPKLTYREKAGPNTENIVQLASAGVDFPAIHAGNPLSVHAVDSAKTSRGIPLLRLEDVKRSLSFCWTQERTSIPRLHYRT
jgi:hypothetical protein